eukprot:3754686-Pyramimonas_sp.AAC.1
MQQTNAPDYSVSVSVSISYVAPLELELNTKPTVPVEITQAIRIFSRACSSSRPISDLCMRQADAPNVSE